MGPLKLRLIRQTARELSIYIRSEIGVQKHCNFDRQPVTELINDFDYDHHVMFTMHRQSLVKINNIQGQDSPTLRLFYLSL